MKLSDGLVANVAAELGEDVSEWTDSLGLDHLVLAAQSCGLLVGVTVHQLVPLSGRDDSFLLTVNVTPVLTVCSAPVHWRDVRPQQRMNARGALRHTLERLQGMALDAQVGLKGLVV